MENMDARGKRSDSQIANVDVRQAPMALLISSGGADAGRTTDRFTVDGTVAGSTEIALMTVGVLDGTKLDVTIQPMFNGGTVGAAVTATPATSTAGVATILAVVFSDDQLAYMTSAKVTVSLAGATVSFPTGVWELYLLKKAVLG